MLKKLLRIMLACSMISLGAAASAAAQTANNRTTLTFTQPVEVPGKVLPAGTYTFELNDSQQNRHIVQIYDQAGQKLIATVLALPNYRNQPTDGTVVNFGESPAGQPQPIRAWFYPGQTTGNEFVYSKTRAAELAAMSTSNVPAVADTMYSGTAANFDKATTSDIVTMNSNKSEQPYKPVTSDPNLMQSQQMTSDNAASRQTPRQTNPTPTVNPQPTPAPVASTRDALPQTASELPLIALLGATLLGVGAALRLRSARA